MWVNETTDVYCYLARTWTTTGLDTVGRDERLGAGPIWAFIEARGTEIRRSERIRLSVAVPGRRVSAAVVWAAVTRRHLPNLV